MGCKNFTHNGKPFPIHYLSKRSIENGTSCCLSRLGRKAIAPTIPGTGEYQLQKHYSYMYNSTLNSLTLNHLPFLLLVFSPQDLVRKAMDPLPRKINILSIYAILPKSLGGITRDLKA